jgi:hypothetical protein
VLGDRQGMFWYRNVQTSQVEMQSGRVQAPGGWAHVRPLNFPQPEELAAYARAGERCDERGLPLSLAPDPQPSTQGAPGQRPPMSLSTLKPGKSGFFGVSTSSTASQVERCRLTA